jgi:hypothetical protein
VKNIFKLNGIFERNGKHMEDNRVTEHKPGQADHGKDGKMNWRCERREE